MDDIARFLKPIPPYREGGWDLVPPPQERGEPLVDVTDLSPRVRYGASYLSQGLPGALDRCWLRAGLWERLQRALDLLPQRWSLLIFDGLRPLAVQRALYDQFAAVIRAERPGIGPAELELLLDDFVAKPVKRPNRPAPHTTGGAVDLTLCLDGVPLDMGIGFDDLTAQAHTAWFESAETPEGLAVRDRRRLLYHVMAEAGLVSYDCEWWHYAYGERMWAREHRCAPIYGFCPECDL